MLQLCKAKFFHYLLVKYQTQYKVAAITYKIVITHGTREPSYLTDVMGVPVTDTYYRSCGSTSSSLIIVLSSCTYSLEQSATTCHLRPFLSNILQAKDGTLSLSIAPLIRDQSRNQTHILHLCCFNVWHQSYHNNNTNIMSLALDHDGSSALRFRHPHR